MSIEERARAAAAVCKHSRHPPNGAARAADLVCRYGRGAGYHNLTWHPPGSTMAQLSCDGCSRFEREA